MLSASARSRQHEPLDIAMTSVLTHCLALMVLLHATLGCCLHHAHACAERCCETPSPKANDCGCHHHDESEGDVSRVGEDDDAGAAENDSLGEPALDATLSHSSCSSRHHGSHRCDGGECQFVARGISERAAVKLLIATILTEPPAISTDALRETGRRDSSDRERAPNLKLPLLHCALLI